MTHILPLILWLTIAFPVAHRKNFQLPVKKNPRQRGFFLASSRNPLLGRYGWVRNHGCKFHEGIDILGIKGKTPVYSAGSGKVIRVDRYDNKSYGRLVVILHKRNIVTLYAHLHRVAKGIRVGKHIKRGKIIGWIGNSGNARYTPAHLHFETGCLENPYGEVKGQNIQGFDPLLFILYGKIYYGQYDIRGLWQDRFGNRMRFRKAQKGYCAKFVKLCPGYKTYGYSEGFLRLLLKQNLKFPQTYTGIQYFIKKKRRYYYAKLNFSKNGKSFILKANAPKERAHKWRRIGR